jgi:signal peptidase I
MDNENPNPPQAGSENPSPASPTDLNPASVPAGPTPAQPAPQQHPLDAPASKPTVSMDSVGGPTSSAPQLNPLHTAQPAVAEEPPSALSNLGSGFASVLGAIFSWIIFPVAVVLILHNFVFQAYHVLGTSMLPTLHDTDYLIVSKVGYTEALIGRALHENDLYIPARGQIIVFHYPKDPTKIFVKRVVGLPGDHIVIKNGTVTIFNTAHPNGFNPDLSYEPTGTQTLIDTDEVVQPGNLFVMGDNRTPGGSFDSREWGELPSSYIIGNAVLRLLPLDQVRIL